jgi:hypothetical protein
MQVHGAGNAMVFPLGTDRQILRYRNQGMPEGSGKVPGMVTKSQMISHENCIKIRIFRLCRNHSGAAQRIL